MYNDLNRPTQRPSGAPESAVVKYLHVMKVLVSYLFNEASIKQRLGLLDGLFL